LGQVVVAKVFWHTYYSKDDGLLRSDLIPCNSLAYREVWFDTVLVQATEQLEVAKLLLIFEVSAFWQIWQMAQVQYFRPTSTPTTDSIIGQSRLASQDQGEFILLSSIVRSCHLIPVQDIPGNYYLNDLAAGDTDLYLCFNNVD
jgi:hypothetical protein